MPFAEDINIEEYFDQYAEASALAEASAFPTVVTGPYRVQVTKYAGKKFPNDPRPFATLYVTIQDEAGSRKLSSAFADVSWLMGRDQGGRPDRGFKLWNEMTRALYPDLNAEERAKKDVGTVLKDVQTYPMQAFVLEKFKVGEKWVTAKTTEEAAQYRSAGSRVINTVANFSRLR